MTSRRSPRIGLRGKGITSHHSTLTREFTSLGVDAVRLSPESGRR
jgi:hypothetical protein